MVVGMGSYSSPSTIGSPDFIPTFIHLITMPLAMHLPHRCFLDFQNVHPTSPPLPSPPLPSPSLPPLPWTWLPKLGSLFLYQVTFVWSRRNFLCVFLSFFPIGVYWNFREIKNWRGGRGQTVVVCATASCYWVSSTRKFYLEISIHYLLTIFIKIYLF